MIKIAELTKELIGEDEIALEALKAGILNLSAYAEKIQPNIEKKLYKKINKGTIVTALSRLSEEAKAIPPLKPVIKIRDLSIKSPLAEISFDNTESMSGALTRHREKMKRDGFWTMTQGVNEITVIINELLAEELKAKIKTKTKGEYKNLAGITIRFDEAEYIEEPNMIYALVAALASKRINLIEVISTYTEITFVIRQKDMERTIGTFKELF